MPETATIAAMRCLCLVLISASVLPAAGPQGYYRQPALHGDALVFASEGDLWKVPAAGGTAQRLTTHPGKESFPAISSDGKTVAFSAEYEGPQELYTMPLDGGLPVRHTFDASDPVVCGWTPQGEILYSTEKHSTLPNHQLVVLDPATHRRGLLPLAQASHGAVDPANGTLVFVRLPKQHSSTKRYRGGWAENLWRFREGDAEAAPLCGDDWGTNREPMWWQGRIYFVSDRDGILNLWSMQPDGSAVQQVTRHRSLDVKSPCLHGGRIVYQHGADLRLLDLASGRDETVPITLATDFDQRRERWVKKPMEYLTAAHLAPSGDRVVLTARGQVFVVPVEGGRLVEAPRKEGVRYRNGQFFPDGTSLLVESDESGEIEFWKLPANGVGVPQPLSQEGAMFRYNGRPSLDGKWIAWSDRNHRLWVRHLESQKSTMVAESMPDEISDFAWAPDSSWLAYAEEAPNTCRQIRLYRVADGRRVDATSDRVHSFSPAWSPDGKWLYFLSDRELRTLVESPWGPRQPEPYFAEVTKIYALSLQKGLRFPFRQPDEPGLRTTGKPTAQSPPPAGAEAAPAGLVVDAEGLRERIEEVPVPAGNYRKLAAGRKHLYWTSKPEGFDAKQALRSLEIKNRPGKPAVLVEDISGYELSLNGKKLLLRRGDSFFVIASDAAAPAKLDDAGLKLDGWAFSFSPQEEWKQIYAEAWRMLRDFFYDRGMHGLDWPAVRQKYLPLVERVADRAELNDVLSEMLGELSALHLYVRLGDLREGPEQIGTASLGGRFSRDDTAGGWRLEHVFRTDPDFPSSRSPLARPGVEAHPGDILTAINGRSALALADPAQALRNLAGRDVLLEFKRGDALRDVVVRPVTAGAETDLRYDEWEFTRRLEVEEKGQGKLGYVHLRAMGEENMAEWARDFYPVFNRQGLIIDVRNNRGGNIDSWILGRLLRKAWFFWAPPVGSPYWNMQYAFRGHLVVLCNEKTASDGEAFCEGFKRLGLGKVIGTRTWGGEIWLNAQRWLVDNGMATAAERGVYGPEGTWLIEGHGVDPDIVVDNPPHATFAGQDAQLDAAIRHLQELIAKDPRPVPPVPQRPNKAGP